MPSKKDCSAVKSAPKPPQNPNPKWYDEVKADDGTVSFVPKQVSEPGIYLDMPIDVYHAQLAVSCTGIKQLIKSPWHYWASSPLNPDRMPFKKTPALIKGQKFHKYLLERKTFWDDYVVKSNLKKDGTPRANAVHSATGTDKETGKEFIGAGELEDIKTAVNVLERMLPKTVDVCLRGALTEVSMFWRDEETGILCRCRHDIFKPMVSTDYKTSADVSPRDCVGALVNYDYPIQAALYLDGNKAVFRNHLSDDMRQRLNLDDEKLAFIEEHSNYVFLFQESSFPLTPYALTVEDDLLERGRELYRHGLRVYQDCVEKYGLDGTPWAAYKDEIVGVGKDELDFYGKGWYFHKEV